MRYRVLKGGGGWREMGRGANRDPAKIFLVSHCVLFFFIIYIKEECTISNMFYEYMYNIFDTMQNVILDE